MNTNERPTPETDVYIKAAWGNGFAAKELEEPMRRLERERDEAREENEAMREENARLSEALQRIASFTDAPDIDPIGDIQFGLHCGVEDRDCSDRYEGADFGYTQGIERAFEWVKNEATYALSKLQPFIK